MHEYESQFNQLQTLYVAGIYLLNYKKFNYSWAVSQLNHRFQIELFKGQRNRPKRGESAVVVSFSAVFVDWKSSGNTIRTFLQKRGDVHKGGWHFRLKKNCMKRHTGKTWMTKSKSANWMTDWDSWDLIIFSSCASKISLLRPKADHNGEVTQLREFEIKTWSEYIKR